MQKHFPAITDDVVRSAVLLAGGGDRATNGSCGVFSGGLMALSVTFSPRSDEPTDEELSVFYRRRLKLHEFRDWFIAEFGGVACKDVQRCQLGRVYHLMDPDDLKAFAADPGIREKCAQVYTKAALKVSEILSVGDSG